jgi:predicted PurR-regulated permease PerM
VSAKTKHILLAATAVVVLFIIFNFEAARQIASGRVRFAVYPIFVGALFALILNVPLRFFEEHVFARLRNEKLKRGLSLATVLILLAGFIVGLGFLIVPHVAESVRGLADTLPALGESALASLGHTRGGAMLANLLGKAGGALAASFESHLPRIAEMLGNIVATVASIFIGIALAVLLLANKDKVARDVEVLLSKRFDQEKLDKVKAVGVAVSDKFSRFLGGQVIEACLVGFVCFLGMTILRIPYAPLVSLIIGVTNLVPILGGYVGGVISVLIIFTVSPAKALIFLIFNIVLQQVEGVTTYPLIVGKSVELSPFWVLTAVVVGGGLFGFWGFILAVPTAALVHDFYIKAKET